MAAPAEKSLNGARPALGVLPDQPLYNDHDDRLGYSDFADALAELIDHPDTDTPLTVAISGPWGVGKTTLANLVAHRLETWPGLGGEPEHITCWFNAWMHDDAPHLGSAFAAVVAKEANKHRGVVRRFLRPLPSTLLCYDGRRRRLLYLALTTLSVVALAAFMPLDKIPLLPSLVNPETLKQIHNKYSTNAALLLFIAIPSAVTAWAKISSAARGIAGFSKDPRKEAGTGSMKEVSDQLGYLLQQAMDDKRRIKDGRRRFIIFVDDLERCKPPRAVEVCEVAKQLLSHPGVVTVLVADMASIAKCADIKYASLEDGYPVTETPQIGRDSASESYGQRYLEKIVQIQFDLPVPPASAIRNLMKSPTAHKAQQTEEGAPESDRISVPEPTPDQKEHRLDVASRRGWKIAFLLSVLVFTPGLLLSPNPDSGIGKVFTYTLGISISALVVFLLIRFDIFTQRWWRRSVARRHKKAIDKQLKRDGGGTGSKLERIARIQQSRSGKVDPGLIKQRFARHANDEQLRQADTALSQFPPPLPRAAKRLVNLLRVLLLAAERRKMLGGAPEVTVQHLVKWAVLICGWPQLGSALRAVPERIADLEGAADSAELTGRLRELGYGRPVTKDLVDLLQTPVKLAPVMSRIVAYEPAAAGTNADGLLTISTPAQASSDGVLGDGLPRQGAVKNGSAEH